MTLRRAVCVCVTVVWFLPLTPSNGQAGEFRIQAFDSSGDLTWTNAFQSGVVTVETSPALAGLWSPNANYFTTGEFSVAAGMTSNPRFFRLKQVISAPILPIISPTL